jgi:hypothetical protein
MYAAELLLPPNRSFGQPAEQNPNVFLLVPGLIVVGGIAASALFYFQDKQRQREQERAESEADPTVHQVQGPGQTTGVPGVSMGSRVIMNENLWAFVKELRQRVNFDLYITSGVRDAVSQARAMNTNYKNRGGATGGGRAYLVGLYGPDFGGKSADALERGGEPALAEYVQWRIDNGKGGSGHLAGQGLDFAISKLSKDQQNQLISAGESLGADTLHEGDHIHMDEIGGSAMQAAQAAAAAAAAAAAEAAAKAAELAKKNRNLAIGASVVGAAVLLGGVYFTLRKS